MIGQNHSGMKVALVTGASSGIGAATVKRLNEAGFVVYAAARRVDRMKKFSSPDIHALQMDVTDDVLLKRGVDKIIADCGHIDVLVNNAGYGSYGAIEDVPLTEARRQFEVNIFGLARLCQLVLPHMRKNHYGKIVNMSSMGGKLYTPLGGWYHATKHALEGLSDCMRIETKEFGIDVIIIEPGAIKTEWSDIAVGSMLKTSGNTDYSKLAQATARMYQKTYTDPNVSSPDVIARLIVQAVTSKKPKTRYVAGHMAKMYLFLRKVLSDKMLDEKLLAAVKKV